MELEPHEVWLLVLTGIAAVGGITGVWLWWWGWIDRPQHAWNVTISPELNKEVRRPNRSLELVALTPADRHKATVSVRPIGTAIAHDTEVRVGGSRAFNTGDNGLRVMHMTAASDPITFDVFIHAEEDGLDVYAEVTWIRIRPHRHVGQRINLRTRKWEYWRWYWHSLRVRRWRLVRTKGRWVAPTGAVCPRIPDPNVRTPRPKN